MAKTNAATVADIFPASEARVTSRAVSSVNLGELFMKADAGDPVVAPLRTFSSGKQGYGFYGKLRIGDRRVQCSVNLVILAD